MADTKFKKGQKPWNKDMKGIHLSPDSEFKKGVKPWCTGTTGIVQAWNKGKVYSQIANEKHFNWKGDAVSYSAVHSWVGRKLGKPLRCEECGKTGGTTHNYHWASISRLHKRDLNDWKRMCVSCHKFYDLGKIGDIRG